jgi:hypothetical protein
MKKISAFTSLVLLLSIFYITNIQTINGEISPSPETPEDEHFFVHHTFWAFGGFYPVCSFKAASGDYIQFTVSSTNSDPDRPDDKYTIELQIASTNHPTTTIQGTQFRETVLLNYSDTYNITAAKHPFYSSVTISGEITIHHQSAPLTTNPPISTVPTHKPTQNPTANNPTNSISSPSPAVPELSLLAILPLFLSGFVAVMLGIEKPLIEKNKKGEMRVKSPPERGVQIIPHPDLPQDLRSTLFLNSGYYTFFVSSSKSQFAHFSFPIENACPTEFPTL